MVYGIGCLFALARGCAAGNNTRSGSGTRTRERTGARVAGMGLRSCSRVRMCAALHASESVPPWGFVGVRVWRLRAFVRQSFRRVCAVGIGAARLPRFFPSSAGIERRVLGTASGIYALQHLASAVCLLPSVHDRAIGTGESRQRGGIYGDRTPPSLQSADGLAFAVLHKRARRHPKSKGNSGDDGTISHFFKGGGVGDGARLLSGVMGGNGIIRFFHGVGSFVWCGR